jgi:serine/threonine-protein kinase
MTPERWRQIEDIVQAALTAQQSDRNAFVQSACAGDNDLLEQVESLLANAEPPQDFLHGDPIEDEATAIADLRFGRYIIETLLGSGGMGDVYLAYDTTLERKVALKLLSLRLSEDEQWRARFIREARMASALDHPNICTIHEAGATDGRPFIAMQYVEGEPLARLIEGRPLPVERLLFLGLQVAHAVSAAHAKGIVHRDIKAGNVMISPQDVVKVLDFGLAKRWDAVADGSSIEVTAAGEVLGTPSSMAPEQISGNPADPRSDIFSFGVVLYQMATGRRPFDAQTRAEVMRAVLGQPHVPAARLNERMPRRLSAIIDRALAKDPKDRYSSMEGLIADLQSVKSEIESRSWLSRSAVQLRWVTVALLMGLLVWAAVTLLPPRHSIQPLSSPSPIRSIAVLPFKPLTADMRDEALELGMADTLIARLSNIHQLRVRPISAVRKYASFEQDAISAGREQRVDAVLDGQIQKAGEKVRLSVQLWRVIDGTSLWTGQFDDTVGDIFAVQDSISERVAAKLEVTVLDPERRRLVTHHTNNPEAYQAYLRARYQLSRLTDDGFIKGRDFFRSAIEIDPDYALAHAGLADAYNRLSGFNAIAPRDGFPIARASALKALQLDDGLSEAHSSLASVEFFHDWDWPAAEREFKRAIETNPSNSDAHQMYSYYLSSMGRAEEALAEMNRALELDPASLEKISGVGEILYSSRQYDRATRQYQVALEMEPNSGFTHWALGNVYLQKKMYAEAIAEYQTAIPLSGDSPDEPASLAHAYALIGKTPEARQILDRLKEQSKRRYVAPATIAFIYSGLGDRNEAFAWLDKAYEARDIILVLLNADPNFDELRPDPRFKTLLRRMSLAQ